jgi:hypothetical protein
LHKKTTQVVQNAKRYMDNVKLVYKWKLVLVYRNDMIDFLIYVITQNHYYMETHPFKKEFKRKKKTEMDAKESKPRNKRNCKQV